MIRTITAEYYVVSYRTYSASILEMVMLVEFINFSLFIFLKRKLNSARLHLTYLTRTRDTWGDSAREAQTEINYIHDHLQTQTILKIHWSWLAMAVAAMIIVNVVPDLAKIHLSPFIHIGSSKDCLCQKISRRLHTWSESVSTVCWSIALPCKILDCPLPICFQKIAVPTGQYIVRLPLGNSAGSLGSHVAHN